MGRRVRRRDQHTTATRRVRGARGCAPVAERGNEADEAACERSAARAAMRNTDPPGAASVARAWRPAGRLRREARKCAVILSWNPEMLRDDVHLNPEMEVIAAKPGAARRKPAQPSPAQS